MMFLDTQQAHLRPVSVGSSPKRLGAVWPPLARMRALALLALAAFAPGTDACTLEIVVDGGYYPSEITWELYDAVASSVLFCSGDGYDGATTREVPDDATWYESATSDKLRTRRTYRLWIDEPIKFTPPSLNSQFHGCRLSCRISPVFSSDVRPRSFFSPSLCPPHSWRQNLLATWKL